MITKERVKELADAGYEQVCIWPGTLVVNDTPSKETPEQLANMTPEERINEFKTFMKDQFGVRIEYLEEVRTNPDLDDSGKPISETGDRNDLFFVIHKDDIGKFAVPRLQAGIRWYEDVVSYNGHANLYPKEILEKYEVRW
jgi:hypothetical protein